MWNVLEEKKKLLAFLKEKHIYSYKIIFAALFGGGAVSAYGFIHEGLWWG